MSLVRVGIMFRIAISYSQGKVTAVSHVNSVDLDQLADVNVQATHKHMS